MHWLCETAGVKEAKAQAFLAAFAAQIILTCFRGGMVVLPGLGSFERYLKKHSEFRFPTTRKVEFVMPRWYIRFVPASQFRSRARTIEVVWDDIPGPWQKEIVACLKRRGMSPRETAQYIKGKCGDGRR